jgi:DNA mismatch endonuclease (patch repair protein)
MKVIFVHGCFWHGHNCARGARVPVRNREYWTQKIARNVTRDQTVLSALTDLGWKVRVIWECHLRDLDSASRQLREFLRTAA